jgi:hypothetical protein
MDDQQRKRPVTKGACSTKKDQHDGVCQKTYIGMTKLGAGVLFFYCLRCRMCVGFRIMNNAESPKMVGGCFLYVDRMTANWISS